MATVIRCDRTECVRTAPAGNVPRDWVPQSGHLYCSPRCATLVLGGVWPDDPVPVAYDTALAGEPVDAAPIEPRALRVEVLEAAMRGRDQYLAAQAAAVATTDPTTTDPTATDPTTTDPTDPTTTTDPTVAP